MNRFSRLFGSALIGLAGVAATAIADGPSAAAPHGGFYAHRMRQFDHCLSTLGLSADQQAGIQSVKDEARAAFQADFAALRAAREKLDADLAGGAEKSALGQDVLDKDAAESKLKDDHKAAHDQILAKLNPDQQSLLQGCMQQRHGKGAPPEEPPQ
jgi:hypothetical protein